MRRYLLDTAPLAALLLARPAAFDLITPWLNRHEAATSILSYAEVVEYIKDFSNAGSRSCAPCLAKCTPTFSPTPFWSGIPISEEASENRMEKG
jgi:hypothetical protein